MLTAQTKTYSVISLNGSFVIEVGESMLHYVEKFLSFSQFTKVVYIIILGFYVHLRNKKYPVNSNHKGYLYDRNSIIS